MLKKNIGNILTFLEWLLKGRKTTTTYNADDEGYRISPKTHIITDVIDEVPKDHVMHVTAYCTKILKHEYSRWYTCHRFTYTVKIDVCRDMVVKASYHVPDIVSDVVLSKRHILNFLPELLALAQSAENEKV